MIFEFPDDMGTAEHHERKHCSTNSARAIQRRVKPARNGAFDDRPAAVVLIDDMPTALGTPGVVDDRIASDGNFQGKDDYIQNIARIQKYSTPAQA